MFISNYERQKLRTDIDNMSKLVSVLSTEITMLTAKIKVLEGNTKPKKVVSEAKKAKQREYMRAYKARKKAEKAAQLAQAVA